ncbi:hypothetical protein BU25DRAFT_342366 [Macroventuria anomochaeta]|uniref:Uncharacterized protein n=1 Tax=Macroventuria anomochaeta TaxID=301207 RepID=A0ACB6RZ95_9PLEO|nr:uncharacterized protein BU25DRAFT_342366 [Macroventuria anomochaeta]KAF2627221.1 hypothetical protein BU25DRAFT_342366 [Macroventuria anomochaeta]
MTSGVPSRETGRKTRRHHQKSRDGCLECKRRRKKCDESRPSCTRCILGLIKCLYLSAVPSAEINGRDGSYIPRLPISPVGATSSISPPPNLIPLSSHPESPHVDTDGYRTISKFPSSPSDTDLYYHYLRHVSPNMGVCRSGYSLLQSGMPTLAQQSAAVYHSILAVSAVHLAWNTISKNPPPKTESVHQILLSGYQHYNEASERIRESISKSGTPDSGNLLTSTLILVPFAAASQQINHWISSSSGTQKSHGPLLSTPRDVIILVRGVRIMLETLLSGDLGISCEPPVPMALDRDTISVMPVASLMSKALHPSHNHVMTAMIVTSSRDAFSKLQVRLDSLVPNGSDPLDHTISACKTAFSILEQIRSSAFSMATPSQSEYVQADAASSTHIAPWLRSFVSRPCEVKGIVLLPTEPLTRLLLSFFAQIPQGYLDLVLPLLDQRLENPAGAPPDCIASDLTQKQALALDIYAHWSVLMFLVEEESWWIGMLPLVTLTGMVNRYGTQLVRRLWPECDDQTQWWPGTMLRTLQDIKGCI